MDDDRSEMTYVKATYIGHRLRKELERKFLFMPSTTKVDLKSKLGDQEAVQPRRLELEGYFVGRKPYMTKKNRNLMENRLIKYPDNFGLKWFGVDGEMITLPDPIKYVSTRPPINPSFYLSIGAEYRKAVYLSDFANNLLAERGTINTINVAKYRIDLDMNQVQFNVHHLFSDEHAIAFRLQTMYRHHKLSSEQNLIEILAAKLRALKEAMTRFRAELDAKSSRRAAAKQALVESTGKIISLNAMKSISKNEAEDLISSGDENKLNAYKNEIKHTRQQRDIEMRMRKELTAKIVSTWKELKDIRIKQNYRNTDLKLIIKKKDVNKSVEEKEFEQDLVEEYEDLIAEKREEFNTEMAKYSAELKAWKLQQTRKVQIKID